MADFCNICSEKLFGSETLPEIDVYEFSKQLENGYMFNVLCEGCTMVSIEKDMEGEITIVTMSKDTPEKFVKWTLAEWEAGKCADVFI